MLCRVSDVSFNAEFMGEVEYMPAKREIKVASEELSKQFLLQPVISAAMAPRTDMFKGEGEKTGLRFSQLPEGKSKQGEKIKSILQRFRKHSKYQTLAQHLQRIGVMQGFVEIEA